MFAPMFVVGFKLLQYFLIFLNITVVQIINRSIVIRITVIMLRIVRNILENAKVPFKYMKVLEICITCNHKCD